MFPLLVNRVSAAIANAVVYVLAGNTHSNSATVSSLTSHYWLQEFSEYFI